MFERVRYIKELLYFIHKNNHDVITFFNLFFLKENVNISSYLSSLGGNDYASQKEMDKLNNYNQLMFGK